MARYRCYFCGKELSYAETTSCRFTKKELREVSSKGFFYLERQKDGRDKAKWNKPYTTTEYAQTAIGSFQFCDKCWIEVYDFIKKRKIKELNENAKVQYCK